MNDLRITLVQSDLHWENKAANLAAFAQKLATIPETDLIILPEMFTTGFSMNPAAYAETMQGDTVQWLLTQAQQCRAAIVGSAIIEENGKFYNRLLWVNPDGQMGWYDKRHLFSMGGEDFHYTRGSQKIMFDFKGWRICPMVCYDLRFPVWSRNKEDYDLAIYVANWPERRRYHWQSLLIARAIENQAFVVGVNRVGTDANEIYHSGYSSVIDPAGDVLYQHADTEDIKTVTLSKAHLLDIRQRLPFLKDRD